MEEQLHSKSFMIKELCGTDLYGSVAPPDNMQKIGQV